MITRLLQWRVVSDLTSSRILQAVFGIGACLILAVGAIWLAKLDLSPPQFLLGLAVVLSLAIQLCIFSELIALKRKAA